MRVHCPKSGEELTPVLRLPWSARFKRRLRTRRNRHSPSRTRSSSSRACSDASTLPTQRRIASILSAYDDLIENNTRRIAILEEMARRIYEEWFVRFRFPGHDGVRMVESELGLVPEGWRTPGTRRSQRRTGDGSSKPRLDAERSEASRSRSRYYGAPETLSLDRRVVRSMVSLNRCFLRSLGRVREHRSGRRLVYGLVQLPQAGCCADPTDLPHSDWFTNGLARYRDVIVTTGA